MASSGKKPKITIKPFRHQVQMDPHYAENTWRLLKNAIHEIHKKNASGLSFEELYRNSYNMVLHKYGEKLYNGLREVVQEHLQGVAKKVANSLDESFLEELNEAWNDHKISMLMIRDILMYMDRVYVIHNGSAPVYELGLQLFRDCVTRAADIQPKLLKTLLALIDKERRGEAINRSLFKSITQMLVDLGVNSRSVYEEDFEKPFLEETAKFYKFESQEFIASNSCTDYMKKVEVRRHEELERVRHYLDSSSEPLVREVVERELIAIHKKQLVEMEGSGLIPMLRDDKIEDLSRMYKLFKMVDGGLELIKGMTSTYIRSLGKAVVTDTEKSKEQGSFVQALLDLKDKFDNLLVNAFANDKKFQQAQNKAFEQFINISPKAPEFISLFIDEKLKKGVKGMSEEETDLLLDKVMMLFRFIQEKDVFEKYYKKHLARRLLFNRSASKDTEKSMISKLKSECGFQFTSRLENMFKDMEVSQNTMEAFKAYLKVNKPIGIDLNVQVLTTGCWPTQTVTCCNLPPILKECCEVFKDFYMKNHSGRCLSWQTNMGNAELKARFGTKTYQIIVQTYQMIILLLFNNPQVEVLSYKTISEVTGIPDVDLKRNLLALSCGKYRILLKQPRSKQVLPTDKFHFNKNFKSKYIKIKITGIPMRETEEQRSATRGKVNEDRKHQIEACIVRTMKARKKMRHALLIAEVTRQLQPRFLPNPNVIKKRIESLIEREYLERSAESREIYKYLA